MRTALVRSVSRRIAEAELTYLDRQQIDYELAASQHREYEQLLESVVCKIVRVADAPDHPDGVFVEDAAIVLDEVAVITRPGAESRRGEVESVEEVLKRYRSIRIIEAPGTMDGGDILHAGRTLFAGRSTRTNDDGIAQLRAVVEPFGYQVTATDFRGCLHLKTAVTAIDDRTLLVNPDWIAGIDGFEMIAIDPSEPFAANVLRVGETLVAMDEHPRTCALLRARGYTVRAAASSEMLKAEAGVTCGSIIFENTITTV